MQENKVDGVINFCNDIDLIPQQQIYERLGLPCFGNAEQFRLLTDKLAFKDMCKKYGVDIIPEYFEEDIENDKINVPFLSNPESVVVLAGNQFVIAIKTN